MDPLSIIYSWQALLVAITASGLTEFVKRAINLLHGLKDDDGDLTFWERCANEARRDSLVINQLVLPSCPVVFGALVAVALPMHPEVMTAYVKAHHLATWQALSGYAAWGAACGQFSDYIFTKVKALASAVKKEDT